MNQLIETYKRWRKNNYLKSISSYKHRYAFVGIGNHSLSNLYPCIMHQGIPLSYIYTRHTEEAAMLAGNFKDCKAASSLEEVLNDKTVQGIYISASPNAHYDLVKKSLAAGKFVFVEKPPCLTLSELNDLIAADKNNRCVVGLQKRFSAIHEILKKQTANKALTYSYKYATGAYPEGNAVLDLFIHPLDNVFQLFGEAKAKNIFVKKGSNGSTCFLHLEHAGGVSGSLELSTLYSWQYAPDEMTLVTDSEVYEVKFPQKLEAIEKGKSFLGIPLNKILKSPLQKRVLYDNTGFVPVREYNTLFEQGYYNEIMHLADLCEGRKTENRATLKSLKGIYALMEQINKTEVQ